MIDRRRDRLFLFRRIAVSALLAIAVCYVLIFMKLPYYIYKPGTAEEIGPMVFLAQGAEPDGGSFMLTTVGVYNGNVAGLVLARFMDYDVRRVTEVRKEGESDEEYDRRQEYVMLTSQASAIQAAYTKAGVPYRVEQTGVMVLRTLPGRPAHSILQAGDTVVSIDGKPVRLSTELLEALKGRKAGDTVALGYRRGNKVLEAKLVLETLPKEAQETQERVGVGFVPADIQEVRAEDPGKQVTVKAGDIGGPSAGFMFAMEIYNRLIPGDLTKGYRIAGTGTIDAKGNIGVIGGIRHKVAAAHGEKADIFFAPKDLVPKPGDTFQPVLNTTEAQNQARRIKTDMKIVSVGTMEEAIRYLEALPPKK